MSRKALVLWAGVLLLTMALCAPAMADWVLEDGHKMHFPQLPNETGWDVMATNPVILADDWMCSASGPVTDIHFWGSWMNGVPGTIVSFNLSIHADIPADPLPYSRPGATLWEVEVPFSWVITQLIQPGVPEGWYDIDGGIVLPENHMEMYQYNVFLSEHLPPEEIFEQVEGTIYWLNISATVLEFPTAQWGWKSSTEQWNDDACIAHWGDLTWVDIHDPLEPALSLDLAFVITGGEPTVGACCYDDQGGSGPQCVITTASDCAATYGGVYQGDGTACGGMQACCLSDGTCLDADSICCENEFDGTPQGTGTNCGALEACCLPDGSCVMLDALCCADQGGTPQGPSSMCGAVEACCMPDGACAMLDPLCCSDQGGNPQGQGSSCSAAEACCMPDGSCTMLDPLCCADQGGSPQGIGTSCSVPVVCCFTDGSCAVLDPLCCVDLGGTPDPAGAMACLGDGNSNGVDDACEGQAETGACCYDDGSCAVVTQAACEATPGATYVGDNTACLGDHDANGIDDICEPGWQPGDGHKMHFPQLPDEAGWDVNATTIALADDWMCSETGWVKDIHFWGSWMHGATGDIPMFILTIYEDVPAGVDRPWSHPGEVLWIQEVPFFQAIPIDPPTPEGWYDPSQDLVLPEDHIEYFQYNVKLPEGMWFYQNEGTIYWLGIQALVDDPSLTMWGWKSSIEHWNDDGTWTFMEGPQDWIDLYEPPTFLQSMDMSFVITGESDLPDDTCDFYKSRWEDYAPQGMPDFDQKQNGWTGLTGTWSHCGPVALANCFWWFDSKYEPAPVDPRPFPPAVDAPAPNDGYPLVQAFTAGVDDHDTSNVIPFVDSLALYCLTNTARPGTFIHDLIIGAHNWLTKVGLDEHYTITPIPGDGLDYDLIRAEVMHSQDVILLLGFWEDRGDQSCHRVGGHYVTIAGVCTDEPAICISDPYFDKNEGEPPIGANGHSADVHNDPDNISGPHGQIQHDQYSVGPPVMPCTPPPFLEVKGYPMTSADIPVFHLLNDGDITSEDYTGGTLYTLIEWAVIICPADTCLDQYPGDANSDGTVDMDDVDFLHKAIDSSGPAPSPKANGDANGDCFINYIDIYYITQVVNSDWPSDSLVDCTCQNPVITCCSGDWSGNTNCDYQYKRNLADISRLIDFVYLSKNPLCCLAEGNTNGDVEHKINLADISKLIDHVYLSKGQTAPCQEW